MFISTYEFKMDKKGRVSVPAAFRSNIVASGHSGFISYPSFSSKALEACTLERIEKISNSIDSLNPFEDKRNYFATSVLSESVNLTFDTEGRVILTEKLIKHAEIKSHVLFVGLGKTFQIWDDKNFQKYQSVAKKKAFENRSHLKWENN